MLHSLTRYRAHSLAQEQADQAGVKGEGLFKRDNDESFSPDHQAEMVEVAVLVWNAEFGVHAYNTPLFFSPAVAKRYFTVRTLRLVPHFGEGW